MGRKSIIHTKRNLLWIGGGAGSGVLIGALAGGGAGAAIGGPWERLPVWAWRTSLPKGT